MQRMQADTDARVTKLESDAAVAQQTAAAQAAAAATPPPAPSSVPSTEPVPDVKGSLGAVKVQNGKVVGGVNNPKSPPLPDTPPDYGLTPQEQYDRAFDILRKADYAEAEKAFKAFIDKNPKDKLTDNAKYWYGETLYVQNKYDTAAVAFVDAYQQNPKGTKAPDSLLKLALSLSSLNKTPDACATLNELKTKYPNASASVRSRASEEATKLKCGAQ
jgi:tol-pal system protein YbgF